MSQKPLLDVLTSLRGVAAVVVVVAHIQITLPGGLEYLFHWQNAAVDLFFILSGFTLYYVYGLREDGALDFGRYVAARFARVYPLYLATLLIAGAFHVWPRVIEPTGYPVGNALLDFLAQLLGVNGWPLLGSGVHWNLPTWSISAEFFCYLIVFPILFHLPRLRNESAIAALVAVSTAVSFLAFVVFFEGGVIDTRVYEAGHPLAYWVAVIRATSGFACGWLIYCSYRNDDRLAGFASRRFTPICVAALLFILSWPANVFPVHAVLFFFPLVILGAARPTGAMRSILLRPAFRFLGDISYSIYVLHILLYILFVNTLELANGWGFRPYALYLLTLVGLSTLSYHLFEKPLRQRINRAFAARRRREEAAGEPPTGSPRAGGSGRDAAVSSLRPPAASGG